jgi:WD40 repeat protein
LEKIHIYDISGSHPRQSRSWTEDEQNGIRIYPRQIFIISSWIDRKKHPKLPNEVIIADVDDSHKKTGIFIRINVDTLASTRLEFGDKPLNIVRFHPYFPGIILASTFEDEIIVWSIRTGRCLAKIKLPSTGFVPIVTNLVLGTAADLEIMDDTKNMAVMMPVDFVSLLQLQLRMKKPNIYVFQLNLSYPDVYA